MKVTIERVPRKVAKSFWGGQRDHSTEKAVRIAVQLTEEEKEIIKQSDIKAIPLLLKFGDVWFPERNSPTYVGNLLSMPTFIIEPKIQNESALMEMEKRAEAFFKSVAYCINEIQQHSTGKRELDL